LIVKETVLEVPPLGAGFDTLTEAEPTAATSDAGIWAVSWIEETKVVVRLLPFQRTTLPDTKLEPVTVRVKAGLPAWMDCGFKLEILGRTPATVKVSELEVPPPGLGFETLTDDVLEVATSAAGITAVN
jgi:hypothetical protein